MVEDAFAEATLWLAPPVQVVFLTSPGKQSICEQVIPDLEFLVITFKTGDWTRPVQIRAGQMMSSSTGLSVPCAAEVQDGSSTPQSARATPKPGIWLLLHFHAVHLSTSHLIYQFSFKIQY